MDEDRKKRFLIVTKSSIFFDREKQKKKQLLNDDFSLLEASINIFFVCFSSVETKYFSLGFSQIEIENEVTRKIVRITSSRRII